MRVELMYFKPETGKFYASGEYDSAFDEAWEVFNEVKGFRDAGRLPGLRAGAVDFDILVDIPDRYPALIKAEAVTDCDVGYACDRDDIDLTMKQSLEPKR